MGIGIACAYTSYVRGVGASHGNGRMKMGIRQPLVLDERGSSQLGLLTIVLTVGVVAIPAISGLGAASEELIADKSAADAVAMGNANFAATTRGDADPTGAGKLSLKATPTLELKPDAPADEARYPNAEITSTPKGGQGFWGRLKLAAGDPLGAVGTGVGLVAYGARLTGNLLSAGLGAVGGASATGAGWFAGGWAALAAHTLNAATPGFNISADAVGSAVGSAVNGALRSAGRAAGTLVSKLGGAFINFVSGVALGAGTLVAAAPYAAGAALEATLGSLIRGDGFNQISDRFDYSMGGLRAVFARAGEAFRQAYSDVKDLFGSAQRKVRGIVSSKSASIPVDDARFGYPGAVTKLVKTEGPEGPLMFPRSEFAKQSTPHNTKATSWSAGSGHLLASVADGALLDANEVDSVEGSLYLEVANNGGLLNVSYSGDADGLTAQVTLLDGSVRRQYEISGIAFGANMEEVIRREMELASLDYHARWEETIVAGSDTLKVEYLAEHEDDRLFTWLDGSITTNAGKSSFDGNATSTTDPHAFKVHVLPIARAAEAEVTTKTEARSGRLER